MFRTLVNCWKHSPANLGSSRAAVKHESRDPHMLPGEGLSAFSFPAVAARLSCAGLRRACITRTRKHPHSTPQTGTQKAPSPQADRQSRRDLPTIVQRDPFSLRLTSALPGARELVRPSVCALTWKCLATNKLASSCSRCHHALRPCLNGSFSNSCVFCVWHCRASQNPAKWTR